MTLTNYVNASRSPLTTQRGLTPRQQVLVDAFRRRPRHLARKPEGLPMSSGSTIHPGLHTPSYFDYFERPAIIVSPRAFPQRLLADGTWEVLYALPRFRERAERITETEFNALVATVPNAQQPRTK